MLSSHAVTAGRSTCLTEACLFDINTGGILPDCTIEELNAFPPIVMEAIPYVNSWENIPGILNEVVTLSNHLSEMRKRFSVDGRASERLVKVIEEII